MDEHMEIILCDPFGAAALCHTTENNFHTAGQGYRAVNKKCPGERHIVEPRGFF